MKPLHQAIASTIRYSSYFNYPLTESELHHWLITSHPISTKSLKQGFQTLPKSLRAKIHFRLPPLRKTAHALSTKKLNSIHQLIHLISLIPSIRLIALTGSLAMNNARKHDDIDLMIITSKNTLWLTRPLVTFLLFLFGKKRPPNNQSTHYPDSICINLWLDTQALTVPSSKQNLYTAHEVLQIKPLFDRGDTYQKFLHSNAWTAKFLANASKSLFNPSAPFSDSSFLFLILPFNLTLFLLQYFYMKRKITQEHITLHSAYFHPRDLSAHIDNFLNKTI